MNYILGSILWIIVGIAIGFYLLLIAVSVLIAVNWEYEGCPIVDVLKELGIKIIGR